MEETNKLLITSQEMNMLAKDYQKNAQTMEDVQRSNAWWYCSKPCLLVFGGGGLVLFIILLILFVF
jgi:hypothetical protein